VGRTTLAADGEELDVALLQVQSVTHDLSVRLQVMGDGEGLLEVGLPPAP
jgi:hypothetical protein